MDADGLLLAKSDLPFVQRPYDTHFFSISAVFTDTHLVPYWKTVYGFIDCSCAACSVS